MLWTLMLAIASGTLAVTPVMEAHRANAGSVGFAIAVIVGLLLGGSNAWAETMVADRIVAQIKHLPEVRQERYLRGLYFAALVWMLVATLIVISVVRAIFRLWA